MAQNHVTPDTIRAAFIFLSVGTPVTRAVILFARGRASAHRAGARLVLYQSRAAKRRIALQAPQANQPAE